MLCVPLGDVGVCLKDAIVRMETLIHAKIFEKTRCFNIILDIVCI